MILFTSTYIGTTYSSWFDVIRSLLRDDKYALQSVHLAASFSNIHPEEKIHFQL